MTSKLAVAIDKRKFSDNKINFFFNIIAQILFIYLAKMTGVHCQLWMGNVSRIFHDEI